MNMTTGKTIPIFIVNPSVTHASCTSATRRRSTNTFSFTRRHIATKDKPGQKRHCYDEYYDREGNSNSHKSSLNEQNNCLDYKQNAKQQGDHNQRKPARFFHLHPSERINRASCTSAACCRSPCRTRIPGSSRLSRSGPMAYKSCCLR